MDINRAAYLHGYRFLMIIHSKQSDRSHHEHYRTLREAGQLKHDLESTQIFICGIYELRPDGTMVKL
jgi:hypothetical protein